MDLDAAKRLVRLRASGTCEGCGQGSGHLDVHHRQARGAGGVHGAAADAANDIRNLLALDRTCHDMTEHADEWAECIAMGLRVEHAYQHDARDVPALLHTPQGYGWWVLTDASTAGYLAVDWSRDYRLTTDDLLARSWLEHLFYAEPLPSSPRR